MWSWMKYLYVAIRLGSLWENIRGVRARDPLTTSESYQEAAGAMLADEGVQRWLGRIPPEDAQRFTEGLPVFIWGIDNMT